MITKPAQAASWPFSKHRQVIVVCAAVLEVVEEKSDKFCEIRIAATLLVCGLPAEIHNTGVVDFWYQ